MSRSCAEVGVPSTMTTSAIGPSQVLDDHPRLNWLLVIEYAVDWLTAGRPSVWIW